MESLSLRPKFGGPQGAKPPQVPTAVGSPLRIVCGRFRSLHVTLDEDTALTLERAVLHGAVGAYDDALTLIASIRPEQQCSGVVSVEHSLILWNQGNYLQAAEILRKAIAFAWKEGKDVREHGIYTLIRFLLGEAEYFTEGDFTAVRDSLQETRQWLRNVAIEQLDDVQIYSLNRYYGSIRIASQMLGFKPNYFKIIPHVEEASERSRLSNLRQYLQSQDRLSEGYRILLAEVNHLSDEITKQDSIRSFLNCCSPLDSEPVWFVEGSARLLLATSLRNSGDNDQAEEQFRKSRMLFQEAPVAERLNNLELTIRLRELSHSFGDLRNGLNNWIQFLEDNSAKLDDAKRIEVLQNIVDTAEELLRSPGNLDIRGIFWKFYSQLETLLEKKRDLTSLHIYRSTADRVAFSSAEYGDILLWHDKFRIKYPRFRSSFHLRGALQKRLMVYNTVRYIDGSFETIQEFNKLARQETEFWSKAYEDRSDLSTFSDLQRSNSRGEQTSTGGASTILDVPGNRSWHSEWTWDLPVVYDTVRRLTTRLEDEEWQGEGGPWIPLGHFTPGSQSLTVNGQYRTLLSWLREAIESQELSEEELGHILLSDTESGAGANVQALLRDITPKELVIRISSLSTARWMGTSEILSSWLLKKSTHPEVQRHFLLAFLLKARLQFCSIEAKVVEAKRVLDIIPKLNQTALESMKSNNSSVRIQLALALKTMTIRQGNPNPLFDETSERFLEILGHLELSLQENRAMGSLIEECFTLKVISSLWFFPAFQLQPLALHQFFASFYAAEAAAQKLNHSWAVLPRRSKVQMVLLSTERDHQVDGVVEGICIALGYIKSQPEVAFSHVWCLVQAMKSRGFGWLMHADTLTRTELDVRSVEGTPMPGYVPLVCIEDLRLIASDSCSDVVFVDWYGDAETGSSLLILCFQGCRLEVRVIQKSWKEIEDTIDQFISLEVDDLKGEEAERLLEQLQPLVQPLANSTQPGQTLVFCPAGNMHRIPLHALKLGGEVLIQRNPIIYCSSLAVLKAAFQSRKRHELRGEDPSQESRDLKKCWKASLFGDPFQPGNRALYSLSNKLKVQPYTGDSFTASNFRSEISSGLDLLHFHSHAQFNDKDPLNQCLIFENKKPFTINDIYDLPLAPRPYHATLLACGSGMSKTTISHDVVGLVPAFLYSGASSTVSTLWKFDDADAAVFSDLFYSAFDGALCGEEEIRIDLAKALQTAVLAMRKRSPALYHWAPFVLHGYWMFQVGNRDSRSRGQTLHD